MSCCFLNDTATTEIYALSLHDALPISLRRVHGARHERRVLPARARREVARERLEREVVHGHDAGARPRSEEHTSELQSRQYLVCRLLLEKKHTTMSAAVLCFLHILALS